MESLWLEISPCHGERCEKCECRVVFTFKSKENKNATRNSGGAQRALKWGRTTVWGLWSPSCPSCHDSAPPSSRPRPFRNILAASELLYLIFQGFIHLTQLHPPDVGHPRPRLHQRGRRGLQRFRSCVGRSITGSWWFRRGCLRGLLLLILPRRREGGVHL